MVGLGCNCGFSCECTVGVFRPHTEAGRPAMDAAGVADPRRDRSSVARRSSPVRRGVYVAQPVAGMVFPSLQQLAVLLDSMGSSPKRANKKIGGKYCHLTPLAVTISSSRL